MPEAFCELELCAKNLRELCALCERKTSTKYASRPVGVTSHITPLSIRRGAGGEATLSPYPHHDRLTFQGERAIEEDSVVSVDGNGIDAAILKGKEDRSAAVNEGFV